MHTLVLLSTLFASIILAAPKPIANPQYGASPASVTLTSTVVVATTLSILPSSSSSNSIPSKALESFTPTTTLIPTATPTPKAMAGVFICKDVNWAGTCNHTSTPIGTAPEDCTQLDGTASSIGPDQGFTCIFYTNSYCRPLQSDGKDFIELSHPGTGNLLVTSKGDLNDKIFSFHCLKSVGGFGH